MAKAHSVISFTFKMTGKNLISFMKLAYCFFKYLKIIKKIPIITTDIALIYSLSDQQNRDFLKCLFDVRFENIFSIVSLRQKKLYLVQCTRTEIKSIDGKLIVFTKHPLLLLLMMIFKEKKSLVYIKQIVKIVIYNKFNPKVFLNNFILINLNYLINLDIYTTISVSQNYPFEFNYHKRDRNFLTNVIHYAQATIISFKKDNKDPIEACPSYIFNKDSQGDIHWVWTERYAHLLENVNNKIQLKASGSIMFKLPPQKLISYKKNRVTIFDVAISKEHTFNNMRQTREFFADIIQTVNLDAELKDYQILLKPKRDFVPGHHLSEYLKFIEELEKSEKIRVLNPDTNPYSLIAESKFIITTPFSTIAQIGLEVGTNTIFYYPFMEILANPIYENEIPVIYGREELHNYFKSNL